MKDPDALGAGNPRIKRLRRLSGRRSARVDEGAFVVEGAVAVRQVLAAAMQRDTVDVEAIYVDSTRPDLLVEFDALALAAPVYEVAAGVLASVLPAVSAQPVGAVVSTSLGRDVEEVALGAIEAGRPVLVLVDVADPGNVGTLFRAAEASGCAGVVVVGSSVDVYNPKVVRSSAGSLFRVPFAVSPEVDATMVTLAELGLLTAAAVARGGVGHLDAPLDGALAIVLGNEAHGLDEETVAACDLTVTISMDGPAESLNVAMAGTVLAFEALRQRTLER